MKTLILLSFTAITMSFYLTNQIMNKDYNPVKLQEAQQKKSAEDFKLIHKPQNDTKIAIKTRTSNKKLFKLKTVLRQPASVKPAVVAHNSSGPYDKLIKEARAINSNAHISIKDLDRISNLVVRFEDYLIKNYKKENVHIAAKSIIKSSRSELLTEGLEKAYRLFSIVENKKNNKVNYNLIKGQDKIQKSVEINLNHQIKPTDLDSSQYDELFTEE